MTDHSVRLVIAGKHQFSIKVVIGCERWLTEVLPSDNLNRSFLQKGFSFMTDIEMTFIRKLDPQEQYNPGQLYCKQSTISNTVDTQTVAALPIYGHSY